MISFLIHEISFLIFVTIFDSPLTEAPVVVFPVETVVPVALYAGNWSRGIGVNVTPVEADGYTNCLRASISSLQRSIFTSIPFSTHIHSRAVSITLGPYVFAFTRSFFDSCSRVHSLYEPSYLFASQKIRPFFEVKERVSA